MSSSRSHPQKLLITWATLRQDLHTFEGWLCTHSSLIFRRARSIWHGFEERHPDLVPENRKLYRTYPTWVHILSAVYYTCMHLLKAAGFIWFGTVLNAFILCSCYRKLTILWDLLRLSMYYSGGLLGIHSYLISDPLGLMRFQNPYPTLTQGNHWWHAVIVMTFWYVFRNGLTFLSNFLNFYSSFGIDHDPPCSPRSHDLCLFLSLMFISSHDHMAKRSHYRIMIFLWLRKY